MMLLSWPRSASNLITLLVLQVNLPSPARLPRTRVGWTNVPQSYSPAKEMRLRVLDFGVDKYGLNAYIFDSSNDGRVNYNRVLFSPAKDGTNAVATLKRGEWADVKVTINGGALNGLTAGLLVKVEELTGDLSKVRLFHTSVSRANASWAGWPGEPGFTGDFAEYLAQKFPTSTAADFAILESGIVSEETYVEQGLVLGDRSSPDDQIHPQNLQPDLAMVGYPTTDEFQHQFLGLITPNLPNGAPNPAYDDVQVNGTPDGRVAQRTAFIQRAYRGADNYPGVGPVVDARRSLIRLSLLITALHRNSWRLTPARCWSIWACCPSRRLPTADRRRVKRSARPRPAGRAVRFRSI